MTTPTKKISLKNVSFTHALVLAAWLTAMAVLTIGWALGQPVDKRNDPNESLRQTRSQALGPPTLFDPEAPGFEGPCIRPVRAAGAVYAMTNAADKNQIALYDRRLNGDLSFVTYISTGGRGSGGEEPIEAVDALGAQHPLILSRDGRRLFAVNAGSNEISSFAVSDDTITLLDKVDSGGQFPSSLALDGNLLYVLNSGGDALIAGFEVNVDGTLTPLAGSARKLGVEGSNPPFFLVSPAQIGFNPSGDMLLVTVKGSNTIHAFEIDKNGLPSAEATLTPSHGSTPFGFVFDRRGRLIVSEPFGSGEVGQANASAASSYELTPEGFAQVISGSVGNLQTASCWLAITNDGRYVYSTNNASDTITGYRVERDGTLSLLDANGVSALTGHAPIDLTTTPDGRYLYAVNAGDGTISMYAIDPATGALASLGEISGLPVEDGVAGIAAR